MSVHVEICLYDAEICYNFVGYYCTVITTTLQKQLLEDLTICWKWLSKKKKKKDKL